MSEVRNSFKISDKIDPNYRHEDRRKKHAEEMLAFRRLQMEAALVNVTPLYEETINIFASLHSYTETLFNLRQTSKMLDALVEKTFAGQLARNANNHLVTKNFTPLSYAYAHCGLFSNHDSRMEANTEERARIAKIEQEVVEMRKPLFKPYSK